MKEMGDGFYIITEERSNGMGGFCWYNVELRKHGNQSFCTKIVSKQQFVDFLGWLMANGKRTSQWRMSLKKTDSPASFIHSLTVKLYSVG